MFSSLWLLLPVFCFEYFIFFSLFAVWIISDGFAYGFCSPFFLYIHFYETYFLLMISPLTITSLTWFSSSTWMSAGRRRGLGNVFSLLLHDFEVVKWEHSVIVFNSCVFLWWLCMWLCECYLLLLFSVHKCKYCVYNSTGT